MKIIKPPFLQGEKILADCVRTFLLPDGRDDRNLLPAEGYFFVTSYRYGNHTYHVIPSDVVYPQINIRWYPM